MQEHFNQRPYPLDFTLVIGVFYRAPKFLKNLKKAIRYYFRVKAITRRLGLTGTFSFDFNLTMIQFNIRVGETARSHRKEFAILLRACAPSTANLVLKSGQPVEIGSKIK